MDKTADAHAPIAQTKPIAQIKEDAWHLASELRAASVDFARLEARYGSTGPALRHFGLTAWQTGDLLTAVTLLRAALAFDDQDAATWRDLAFVCNGLGDTQEAYRAIVTAVERDATHARAWLLLGNLCVGQSRTDEADAAYHQALSLDPDLGDAHLALGFSYFGASRFIEATGHLEKAVAHGAGTAQVHTLLGHLCFMRGEYAGADLSFDIAARLGPLDRTAIERWARTCAFRRMIAGEVAAAMKTYAESAGEDALPPDELLRAAFLHLNAYGHIDVAQSVGAARLRVCPDDAEVAYLMAVQKGQAGARAPDRYVEAYFDRIADQFDHKLVQLLGYDGPAVLCNLIHPVRRRLGHILDLGCGTGLAASAVSAFDAEITGVDLSARMLEKAAERGAYSRLVKAEALDFLITDDRSYDLVFAADVLIYFGALEAVFERVRDRLAPDGLFAFSVEVALEGTYSVLPSGRFSHNPAYIERLTTGFTVIAWETGVVRLEARQPVEGLFVVLQRDEAVTPPATVPSRL